MNLVRNKTVLMILLAGCMQNNLYSASFGKKLAIGAAVIAVSAVVVGGAAVAAPYFIPFRFPEPTGPFGVGTEIHHLNIDENKDQCVLLSKKPRKITIQVWYPTEYKTLQAKSPWAPEYVADLKKTTKKVYLLGLDTLVTHSQMHASLMISKKKYPVVLYSHGMGCGIGDNVSLCEDLASKGYIVVGVGHPEQDEVRQVFSTMPEYKKLKKLIDRELALWVIDMQSTLNFLERLSAKVESRFFGKLDLQKIAMAGHSLGGATAVQLCRIDSRCKAAVNFDGPLWGEYAVDPIHKPAMFILASETLNVSEEYQIAWFETQENFQEMSRSFLPSVDKFMQGQGKDVYKIMVNGAEHASFCDAALLQYHSLIFKFMVWNAGGMSGYRCHEIMKAYVTAFFDKYLKNKGSALLTDQPSPFSEVDTQFLV